VSLALGVQRGASPFPARAGSAMVEDAETGKVRGSIAGGGRARAEVDVLEVHEEALIEAAESLEEVARDEKRGRGDPANVAGGRATRQTEQRPEYGRHWPERVGLRGAVGELEPGDEQPELGGAPERSHGIVDSRACELGVAVEQKEDVAARLPGPAVVRSPEPVIPGLDEFRSGRLRNDPAGIGVASVHDDDFVVDATGMFLNRAQAVAEKRVRLAVNDDDGQLDHHMSHRWVMIPSRRALSASAQHQQ